MKKKHFFVQLHYKNWFYYIVLKFPKAFIKAYNAIKEKTSAVNMVPIKIPLPTVFAFLSLENKKTMQRVNEITAANFNFKTREFDMS